MSLYALQYVVYVQLSSVTIPNHCSAYLPQIIPATAKYFAIQILLLDNLPNGKNCILGCDGLTYFKTLVY